jgi:hypothetical protein
LYVLGGNIVDGRREAAQEEGAGDLGLLIVHPAKHLREDLGNHLIVRVSVRHAGSRAVLCRSGDLFKFFGPTGFTRS